jgi:hypothetical protein
MQQELMVLMQIWQMPVRAHRGKRRRTAELRHYTYVL